MKNYAGDGVLSEVAEYRKCGKSRRARKETPCKIRNVLIGRNYWTKLEPTLSEILIHNCHCEERSNEAISTFNPPFSSLPPLP